MSRRVRGRQTPRLERLEERRLLAAGLTEIPLADAFSAPGRVALGPDQAIWFVEANTGSIGRVDAKGAVRLFPLGLSGDAPVDLVSGPDGAIWFTAEGFHSAIGRLDMNGTVQTFPVPGVNPLNPIGPGRILRDIAVGPDGALWVTEAGGHIDRMTTDGMFTTYAVPDPFSEPEGITAGPDGALWFTERSTGKIGRITTDGTITEFALPNASSGPKDIVTGPDGALWFTERSGNQIGRITTDGNITEYALSQPGGQPSGLTVGPDGALWFTEPQGNRVGRITTAGQIVEYALNPYGSNVFGIGNEPQGITAGADGDLWFAELNSNQIARLDPRQLLSGSVTTSVVAAITTGDPIASFRDPNGTAHLGDFTATIQWDNGQSSPGTITQNSDGSFVILGPSFAPDSLIPTSIRSVVITPLNSDLAQTTFVGQAVATPAINRSDPQNTDAPTSPVRIPSGPSVISNLAPGIPAQWAALEPPALRQSVQGIFALRYFIRSNHASQRHQLAQHGHHHRHSGNPSFVHGVSERVG